MSEVSLKEYFEKILVEKDKAINIALQAAEKAVAVAEKNAEKWRDNANEWRGAMTDREKTFMPRSEFNTYKETAEKAQAIEKERADKGEGKGAGLESGWKILIGILGLITTILVIYNFIK